MGALSLGLPQSHSAVCSADASTVQVAGHRTAVVVVHGIGQQRKFETLTTVVEGIRRVAGQKAEPVARNVVIGDERLSRIELELEDGRKVDVYEAYWAPITEGQVGIKDVMAFLWGAAKNGVANARRPFRRWIFGRHADLDGGRKTLVYLVLAAAVLASLAFINSLTVLLGTSHVLNTGPEWLKNGKAINDMTAAILMFLAAVAGFGVAYVAARHQKNGHPVSKKLLVSRFGLWYFMGLCAEIILVAASMALAIGIVRDPFWTIAGQWLGAGLAALTTVLLTLSVLIALLALRRSRKRLADLLLAALALVLLATVLVLAGARGHVSPDQIFGLLRWDLGIASAALAWVSARWIAIWIALAWVSARARAFLVQYVGDVAVYVSPRTLDRFDTLRDRIRECSYKVASALYRAADDGSFLYRNVVILGHSLGSVAAYDCLNRMLNEDAVAKDGGLRVRGRTSGLVTFGSPLDKTAFLFEINADCNNATRAALAATVQPLIGDPATVSIHWDNIYSPWDIISGDLDFFGEAAGKNRVANDVDLDAVTPLGAHNEYWTNLLVWRKLDALLPRETAAVT
jgi:hypothetical protein